MHSKHIVNALVYAADTCLLYSFKVRVKHQDEKKSSRKHTLYNFKKQFIHVYVKNKCIILVLIHICFWGPQT